MVLCVVGTDVSEGHPVSVFRIRTGITITYYNEWRVVYSNKSRLDRCVNKTGKSKYITIFVMWILITWDLECVCYTLSGHVQTERNKHNHKHRKTVMREVNAPLISLPNITFPNYIHNLTKDIRRLHDNGYNFTTVSWNHENSPSIKFLISINK
jgi:hypothetical protein